MSDRYSFLQARRLFSTESNTALFFLLAVAIFAPVSPLRSQSSQSAQLAWESAAGGKMSFGTASIKQSNPGLSSALKSNIDMTEQDDSAATNGLFSATNGQLASYIGFAYKLTPRETVMLASQMPAWAIRNRYDVEAHAAGNPTKDQYRLMMQSLLADRFKLKLSHQPLQIPVYNLVVAEPGKLGPKIRAYKSDPPCIYAQGPVAAPNVPSIGSLPTNCGVLVTMPPSRPGLMKESARDSSMATIAQDLLLMVDGLDRPIVDHTQLGGTYDFTIEWTPEASNPNAGQTDSLPSSIEKALQDQLGLKLETATESVDRVVVDHLEQPTN